jgi:hypothetical protein
MNESSLPMLCIVDGVDKAEDATILDFLIELFLFEARSAFKFIVLSRPTQNNCQEAYYVL